MSGTVKAFIACSSALAVLFAASPGSAGNSSVYTDLDLAKCREAARDANAPLQTGVWWCEGYDGVAVRLEESDLRFFVSYGEKAETELAASQTVPASNHPGRRIEWRLDSSGRPMATILRFVTDPTGEKGATLVITRIGPAGQMCHVGYVDAVANANANEIARRVADEVAPRFRCREHAALDY